MSVATEHTNPICSIIIVTYNGAKWIKKCIDSCLDSDYPINIIVVDNKSTDDTLQLMPKDDRITLFEMNENLGFGGANNFGMEHAINQLNSDYVFLLNQDAYLGKETIGNLIACHQDNPELGLMSPYHFDGLGVEHDYRFKIYIRRAKSKILRKEDNYTLYKSRFVNAAAWFIPRSTLENIGGFDPIFFHTGEDDNFCQRLRKKKIPIAILDNCSIRHDRQDREKYNPPPFKRIITRAKIIIYNPGMNALFKFGLLTVLMGEYIINLKFKDFRTKIKFKRDFEGIKHIWSYVPSYRKTYKKKAIFLKL